MNPYPHDAGALDDAARAPVSGWLVFFVGVALGAFFGSELGSFAARARARVGGRR